MLNLIFSVISTLISTLLSILSFLRGPLLIGLLVGGFVLAFSAEASASVEIANTQCNWVGCPVWENIEGRFQGMIICFIISAILGFILYVLEE